MTTGVFVYGVVEPDTVVPPDLHGVDDAPVRVVTHEHLVGAVVSELTLDRPPGRRADLLAYGRVLDGLAATGPVAPVRFGSVMEDEGALVEELLAPSAAYFQELLAQLVGRVQFNLRATYEEAVVLAEVVGEHPEIARLHQATRGLPVDSAYGEHVRLGELVARALEGKRGWDADMLMEVVSPHVVDEAERAGAGVDHVLNVALLVDQDHQSEFEQVLEDLAEAVHERIHLRLVGPLAPYDFVGAASWV